MFLSAEKPNGELSRARIRVRTRVRVVFRRKCWDVGRTQYWRGFTPSNMLKTCWTASRRWTDSDRALAFSADGTTTRDPWHKDAPDVFTSLNRQRYIFLLRCCFRHRLFLRPLVISLARATGLALLAPAELAHDVGNAPRLGLGLADLADLDVQGANDQLARRHAIDPAGAERLAIPAVAFLVQ